MKPGTGHFQRAIAVLCMLLAFVLSGQTYISVLDRVEHAHHQVHFANPLAGDVQFCGGGHDECGLHHHHHHAGGAADHHSDGAPDHQHGDAVLVFIVIPAFVVSGRLPAVLRIDSESRSPAGIDPVGLDRPPKAFPGIRV